MSTACELDTVWSHKRKLGKPPERSQRTYNIVQSWYFYHIPDWSKFSGSKSNCIQNSDNYPV